MSHLDLFLGWLADCLAASRSFVDLSDLGLFGLLVLSPGPLGPLCWNLELFNTCHFNVVRLIRNVLAFLRVAFIVSAICNGHLSPVSSILILVGEHRGGLGLLDG